MLREIGSNYWIEKSSISGKPNIDIDFANIKYSDVSFLSTGRSAISLILEKIDNDDCKVKSAILPPYTCHTVIEPFVKKGYDINFYDINKSLEPSEASLEKQIDELDPKVILVHGYFGFDTLKPIDALLKKASSKGIKVIEDLTQTMYSDIKHVEANYFLGSFRKWGPLPDGAFATCSEGKFSNNVLSEDTALIDAKLSAFNLKHMYMVEGVGDKEVFLEKYRDAEKILCEQSEIYGMGYASKQIQANINVAELKAARRRNYEVLHKGLIGLDFLRPVFGEIENTVTPLYFTVYINTDRKAFQTYLADNAIYVPIVWPKPEACGSSISEQVEWIYDHVLSFPCDQRYDADDMERIVDTVGGFFD